MVIQEAYLYTSRVQKTNTKISVAGHSFAILPRSVAEHGYMDAQLDDDQGEPWNSLQKAALAASIRTMAASTQTAQ